MRRAFPLPLPADRWTRALLAPVLVFVATCTDRNYQTDLWHHLARGRILVEEGTLANTDRFTFTVPGQPFRDVNWGWQAAFYCLYRAGGLPLVQAANAAVLALAMALLFRLARRQSGSPAVACGACLFTFFGLWPLLIIRPQTFSLLLFVVLLNVLDAAHRRPRLLLAVPPVMALWVNLHGGFPIGLVLVGAHALAAAVEAVVAWRQEGANAPRLPWAGLRGCWPWAAALAAGGAATLLNPYGWRVYDYVGVTSTSAAGRKIDEWLPPGLDTLTGKVWALSLVAALGLSALPGRRPAWRGVVVAGCFLPLACGSVRMVAWWLLALTPVLAAQFAAVLPRLRRADEGDDRPTAGAAAAVVALACAAVLSLPWLERYNPALRLPGRGHRTETDLQAAADRLVAEGRDGGRLFTRMAWGEYLGWALAPRYTVFLDGRVEIFPDAVWGQYAAVTRGRADWEEILDDYGVDRLLLDTGGYHAQLLPLVERSGHWREEGRFGNALLFVRRGAAPGGGQTAAR
jgi:hypothetical protein